MPQPIALAACTAEIPSWVRVWQYIGNIQFPIVPIVQTNFKPIVQTNFNHKQFNMITGA